MQYRLRDINRFRVQATNGEIGRVKDVYFDSQTWKIRYLVIDTDAWLSGRQILLSPLSLGAIDKERGLLQANLEKERIESSPLLFRRQPLSRTHENDLAKHYGWDPYWAYPFMLGLSEYPYYPPVSDREFVLPIDAVAEDKVSNGETPQIEYDPHLQSCISLEGYEAYAVDGRLGEVEDFVLNADAWLLGGMIVGTGHWFRERRVFIPMAKISQLDWYYKRCNIDGEKEDLCLHSDQVGNYFGESFGLFHGGEYSRRLGNAWQVETDPQGLTYNDKAASLL